MALFTRLKKAASVNLVRYLSQFIIGVIIARSLSLEDKGIHFIFTSISSAIAILCSFGLANSIVYHAKKSLIDIRQTYNYVLLSIVLVVVMLCVVFFFFYGYFSIQLTSNELGFDDILLLFFIYTVFCYLNYFINSYCLSFNLMSVYFHCFAGSSILSLLIIMVGCYYYYFDLYDCLITVVAFEAGSSLIAFQYIFMRTVNSVSVIKEKSSLIEVIKYAFKNYLGVSGSTIMGRGDSFILSITLSQEHIGLYSVAKSIFRMLAVVPQTINSVVFGLLCEKTLLESKRIVIKLNLAILTVFSMFVILSYFTLELLITLIWGDMYGVVYHPTFILCVGATVTAATASINPFFLAIGKPLIPSKIVLVSGSIGLLACYVLTQEYGIIGTSYSVLLAASISSLLRVVFFRKF